MHSLMCQNDRFKLQQLHSRGEENSDDVQSSGGMEGCEEFGAASAKAPADEDATYEEAGRKLLEWTQGSKATPNTLLYNHQPPRESEQQRSLRKENEKWDRSNYSDPNLQSAASLMTDTPPPPTPPTPPSPSLSSFPSAQTNETTPAEWRRQLTRDTTSRSVGSSSEWPPREWGEEQRAATARLGPDSEPEPPLQPTPITVLASRSPAKRGRPKGSKTRKHQKLVIDMTEGDGLKQVEKLNVSSPAPAMVKTETGRRTMPKRKAKETRMEEKADETL